MLPSLFLSDNKKWQRKVNVGHVVSPTRPFYNALKYFVANNLLGEWGSMQMTVMSEGLLLNSKYIKMGREEGGFQAFLTQPPLVIVCHAV